MGEVPENPEEKKETVKVGFTSKEAALVHMLYYVGAAIMNHDFSEAEWISQSAAKFIVTYWSDEEIVALKAKMTKIGNDIPPEDLKALEIDMRQRT